MTLFNTLGDRAERDRATVADQVYNRNRDPQAFLQAPRDRTPGHGCPPRGHARLEGLPDEHSP